MASELNGKLVLPASDTPQGVSFFTPRLSRQTRRDALSGRLPGTVRPGKHPQSRHGIRSHEGSFRCRLATGLRSGSLRSRVTWPFSMRTSQPSRPMIIGCPDQIRAMTGEPPEDSMFAVCPTGVSAGDSFETVMSRTAASLSSAVKVRWTGMSPAFQYTTLNRPSTFFGEVQQIGVCHKAARRSDSAASLFRRSRVPVRPEPDPATLAPGHVATAVRAARHRKHLATLLRPLPHFLSRRQIP